MQKVALITGASSGIGLELARLHAARGGDLVLVARRLDRLNALKDEIEAGSGRKVLVIAEDLADPGAPERIAAQVEVQGIAIDTLINNAGFAARGLFHEQDWAGNAAMIQVNSVALAHLTRLFVPGMVARGKGRVLNVASTAALTPGPLQAVYFATKSFVKSLSNALAEELDGTGVTVTCLLPGATASEFAETADMSRTPLFAAPTPASEVAKTGYEAMERGELNVFAGVSPKRKFQYRILPFLPQRYVLKTVRRVQEVPGD